MTEEGTDAPSRPSWLRRHRGKVIASLSIAAVFLFLLRVGKLPIAPPEDAFRGVQWWTVGVYFLMYTAVHFVRAGRWIYLLEPVGRVPLRSVFTVAFVGFAAIVTFPFRTGEVVRPVLVARRGSVTAWAAAGTVAAERIIDGLVLSILLFVALRTSTPLDPLPETLAELPVPVAWVPRAAYGALTLFAVAFLVMAAFYWRRDLARRWVRAVVGLVSMKLADWLSDRVEKVASGLQFLPQLRFSSRFVGATVIYWLGNAAALWFLAWGTGLDVGFAETCTVMGVIALGILVPNAPGFVGAYQLSAYGGLAMFLPESVVVGSGAVFVLCAYACQIAVHLVAGGAALLADGAGLRDALDADARETPANA